MNLNIKDEQFTIQAEGPTEFINSIAQTVFYYKGVADWNNHINNNNTTINQINDKNLPDTLKEKLDGSPLNKKHDKKNIITLTEKTCAKCHQIKTTQNFFKNNQDRTGYQSYCKECSAELRKERRYKQKKNSKSKYKKSIKKEINTEKETSDDTTLFINWMDKLQKEVFDITEFIVEHPEITMEKLQKIISHQIKENHILQLSDSKFKICIKKEQNIGG